MKKQIILTALMGIFLSGPVFAKQSISETVPPKSERTFNKEQEDIKAERIEEEFLRKWRKSREPFEPRTLDIRAFNFISKSRKNRERRRDTSIPGDPTEGRLYGCKNGLDRLPITAEEAFDYCFEHPDFQNKSSTKLHENTAVKPKTIHSGRGRRVSQKKALANK